MEEASLDMIIEAARALCDHEKMKNNAEDDSNAIEKVEKYQRQTTEEER